VSVIAWVKLDEGMPLKGGAFIGGLWNEAHAWRQYALFMDGTGGCRTKDGVVAHISAEGGPSPGQKYCQSRACGASTLQPGVWHCIANTYDGARIRAYVNGSLDGGPENPFLYPDPPKYPTGGIFAPPEGEGADFGLGANFIHPGGGSGPGRLDNMFSGYMRGFAVHDVALSGAELAEICASVGRGPRD